MDIFAVISSTSPALPGGLGHMGVFITHSENRDDTNTSVCEYV